MKIVKYLFILAALAISTSAYAKESLPFIGKTYKVDFGSDLQGVVTFTSDSTMNYGDEGKKVSPTSISIAMVSEGVYTVSWTLQMRSPWQVRHTFNFAASTVESHMESGERSLSVSGTFKRID